MTSKRSASNHELADDNTASDDLPGADFTETERTERSFCNTKLSPVKALRNTCIKTRSDDSEPFISGACFVPNGQIFLCDKSNSKLKLFDEVSGNVRYEIPCERPPYDVAVVDDTKIVISIPSGAHIQFVDIKPGVKLQQQINVKGNCYGVEVYEDDIYVCIANQANCDPSAATDESLFCGIKILSLTGDVKHTIPHTGPGKPNYISLSKDGTKIYYSGGTERQAFLSCITKEGYGLFKYSEQILQNPRSFIVDKEENIIIVDSKTNKLHVIDASGRSQCLLTKKNKPYEMTSICFDCNRRVLGIVCSANKDAGEELDVASSADKDDKGILGLVSEKVVGYFRKPDRRISKLKIYRLEDQTFDRRLGFIRNVYSAFREIKHYMMRRLLVHYSS